MQNLRSSILNARASSLTPPFSTLMLFIRGLLLALPLLGGLAVPASLLGGVGCSSADRLDRWPLVAAS